MTASTERYMERCVSGVIFDDPYSECSMPKVQKRCALPVHGENDHLWVEATNSAGTALVVRWDGMGASNRPREVLVAS